MWRPGLLVALDLGIRVGIAAGHPGAVPRLWAVSFKDDEHRHGRLYHRWHEWLRTLIVDWDPAGLVFESTLPLIAYRNLGTSEAAVQIAFGLRCIVEMVCHAAEVPCQPVAVNSVRKHFIGMISAGGREETKRAVIARCKQLGYLRRGSSDADAADAGACWDYAAETLMRVPPEVLTMWGGGDEMDD